MKSSWHYFKIKITYTKHYFTKQFNRAKSKSLSSRAKYTLVSTLTISHTNELRLARKEIGIEQVGEQLVGWRQ